MAVLRSPNKAGGHGVVCRCGRDCCSLRAEQLGAERDGVASGIRTWLARACPASPSTGAGWAGAGQLAAA